MADKHEALARWHRFVATGDKALLPDLLAEDVHLHTPVYLKPRVGREIVSFLLGHVAEIFENFAYHREFVAASDGALEFSANIGRKSLKGVDLIHWNERGEIADFEVCIRPANAIEALAGEMLKRLQAAGRADLILE